tara:strand:+ start:2077 stop:2337 length:261 start_codon:yes stop_codon:yes gene_type:complete
MVDVRRTFTPQRVGFSSPNVENISSTEKKLFNELQLSHIDLQGQIDAIDTNPAGYDDTEILNTIAQMRRLVNAYTKHYLALGFTEP